MKNTTNTTIAISKEMKEKIAEFGNKGETYDDIIRRFYAIIVKEQLRQFLMSEKGFIPIEKALEEAHKRWPK